MDTEIIIHLLFKITMEKFDKIIIDFNGHLEMAKDDMKITRINPDNNELEKVDVSNMTAEQIVEGLKMGEFYISFVENYQHALDGSDEFFFEIEKAEE